MTASEPRLYLTPDEADVIRGARDRRAEIRRNVVASAIELSNLPVRTRWIPPEGDDRDYENLYDRFYAAMSDAAILEQLAFGALLSGRADLSAAASRWLVGVARAWRPEVAVVPDYGTAYSISRLIKGVAVGWDLLAARLTPAERRVVRAVLVELVDHYWDGWYSQSASADSAAHTHHAHLEWASLGVAALALDGQTDEARIWLDAAIEKFQRDLVPFGLADDGAQVEGASFWASTMFYRFLFLDPLRRVSGLDLVAPAIGHFDADMSIAAIAGPRRRRIETENESILLEPEYAQLGYHAPALVALARLHRSPHLQALAGWDPWLGRLHESGHRLPSGERLRFCLGPYALAWFDPSVPARLGDARRAFQFPSVDEAYLRDRWSPGGLVVSVKSGRLAVHAGGRPVLVDLTPGRVVDRAASVAAGTGIYRWDPPDLDMAIESVVERPDGGRIRAVHAPSGAFVVVDLRRGRLRVERGDGATRAWWAAGGARRTGERWSWATSSGLSVMELVRGRLVRWSERGHRPERNVGYGRLRLLAERDPSRALTIVEPDSSGRLIVDIRLIP